MTRHQTQLLVAHLIVLHLSVFGKKDYGFCSVMANVFGLPAFTKHFEGP